VGTRSLRQCVLDLHGLLSQIDRVGWGAAAVSARRAELDTIRARLDELVERSSPEAADVAAPLAELLDELKTHEPDEDTRARWLVFRRALLPSYIAIAESLRKHGEHLPSLRPTNYVRNVWHVLNTSIAVGVLLLAPHPNWVIAASASVCFPFWFLEWIRRRRPALNQRIVRFFRLIVHPHEAVRVNSATWFATALFLLALTRSTLICVPALAVLGAGDPVAALVGRRFGRTRLVHGRTLEGSLAFLLAGTAAAWGVLSLTHASVGAPAALGIALAAALGGALAELLSLRIDDNVSVPVVAAGAAAAAAWGLGVPLF